jgi:multiple sugar transport system permease protein
MTMATVDHAQAPSHAAPAAEKTRRPGLCRAGGNLVRVLLVGFFAFPLLFMFMSSLKPDDQIFADLDSIKAFLPVGDISLSNYTGVFETVPAARVDGAGWSRIYRSVVMPLAGPAIATVAILTFLPAWNSYLWPLMVVQTENLRPVMVGSSYFQQLKVLWGQIVAYSTIVTIPVLVMFLALQRQFIRSIASAGVKG